MLSGVTRGVYIPESDNHSSGGDNDESSDTNDQNGSTTWYRLRFGNRVKHIILGPEAYPIDTLLESFQSTNQLPVDLDWTMSSIFRDQASGEITGTKTDQAPAGINGNWHEVMVDCLDLEHTMPLKKQAFEATVSPIAATTYVSLPTSTTMIAKIALSDRYIPYLERETKAYKLLEGTGLAPRFLGYVHENGRIIGFLLQKLEGRSANVHDMGACAETLGKLHEMGLVHGHLHPHHFLVTEEGVKLLDLSLLQDDATPEMKRNEIKAMMAELVEVFIPGGGFTRVGNFMIFEF